MNPAHAALARLRAMLEEQLEGLRAFPGEVRALPARVRAFGTKEWLHVASLLLVSWSFLAWFQSWHDGNANVLWDPLLQPDDARTAIFPFHRYAEGSPLADDPIANEMLEYQPYAYRLLFWVLVPWMGLLPATKVIQTGLFLTFAWGGYVIATSRRGGFGAGLLFTFVFLRDIFVQERVLGGLPRGFGFPVCALWLAGALAHRPWVRRTAALMGALSYPTALAMVLGAEGIYSLRGFARPGLATLFRRLRHFAILVAACGALLAPAVFVGMSDGGPIHTLEQAEREPAFGRSGRLRVLPFEDTGHAFGQAFMRTYRQMGDGPELELSARLRQHADALAIAMVGISVALLLMRFSATPAPVMAFLAGSLILYAIARTYAFRLYSPERFYSIGMRIVGLGLTASAFGLIAPRVGPRLRGTLRNVAAALVIFFIWLTFGNGVRVPQMGYFLDYRRAAPFWEFVKSLPLDTRVAYHPDEQDGHTLPLFGERAINGGFETMQPWLTESWARQKARAEETLDALYATRHEDVFAYADKYRVSHFLINESRYTGDFVRKSKSFEPLTSYARELLRDRSRSELVFGDVPEEAVVFRYSNKRLVSVKLLKQAWSLE